MGDGKDRREAIDVANALYHLREHLPLSHARSRAQLAALCRDYDLLGDIANATKHGVITHGSPQIFGDDSIYEILVTTKYKDQGGDYDHQEKVVEVKLIDGSTRDVYEILTNVVNMWFDELYRIGAIEKRMPIILPGRGLVVRKDASSVNLQLTQGIRWKQHFRFQQYNYETNKIEAIDLSNAQNITFTVRKPQTFEIQMGDEFGLNMTHEIELTPEQVKELNQIHDSKEREEYLLGIAIRRGIVEQMLAEHQNTRNKDGQS